MKGTLAERISEAAQGMWEPLALWAAIIVGVWFLLVRPLKKQHPRYCQIAERLLAVLFLVGFVVLFFVRFSQVS